jgi:hypothetical protein
MTFTSVNADGFNPFNVINPNKWFDDRNNDYHTYNEPLPPPLPPPLLHHPIPYGIPYAPIPYGISTIPYWNNYPIIWQGQVIPPATNPPNYNVDSNAVYRTNKTYEHNTISNEDTVKDQMARRIKELEIRLEEVETKYRQPNPPVTSNIISTPPSTPNTNNYPNYSGDQIFNNSATKYPFRPLDLER